MPARQDQALVNDLRRLFRTLGGALIVLLVLGAAIGAYLVVYLEPRVQQYTHLAAALRVSHQGMVDQDAGLRGWLSSGGDPGFEEVAARGADATAQAETAMREGIGLDADLDRLLLDMRLAQQAWLTEWAEPAAGEEPQDLEQAALRALLVEGQPLFDDYREQYEAAINQATTGRDRALTLQRVVLTVGVTAGIVAAVLLLLVTYQQRRRLEARVLEPVQALLATMERVQQGDLAARPQASGPRELRQVAEGLDAMISRLAAERERLEQRRAEANEATAALRDVLTVAREVAGSLSTGYVAEATTAAACRIAGCASARIWLVPLEGGDDLWTFYDSALGRHTAPSLPPVHFGDGAIGAAARDGQMVTRSEEESRLWALPLVVGGKVIGVLELRGLPGEDGPSEPVETLATHAAAALQTSRLHQQAEHLSNADGLTGLLNRRRLDADLTVELERAQRYERSLGFVLLDLDYFKQLNDAFGHQHGDAVLRRLATVLTATVRSSDSIYRYGGEELAVLVHEGALDTAVDLAERLRQTVERSFDDAEEFAPVTASFGVAAFPDHAESVEELIGAADRALYRAKESGRNRVVVAEPAHVRAQPADEAIDAHGGQQ